MPERITKFQRWLDLIAYLVGKKLPVSVEDIMENVPAYEEKWRKEDETARATARRTFERDKDELRALGIPIETVRYRINYGRDEIEGYRLSRKDFYLPYLRLVHEASPSGERRPYMLDEVVLTDEEVQAAADALHLASQLPAFPFAREARSALCKLAFDLDPEALTATPELYVDRPDAEEILERLRPLSDALIARKVVWFRYHGIYRGEVTDREVRPYGLVFLRGNWYLIGYDVGREAIRVFRVGRTEDVKANQSKPHTPDYEIPADFRLDDYLRREAWELGDEEPIQAEVLFRFPRSLWAERNGHGRKVEERPDGSAVRVFDVQQVNPFLRWILTMEGEAEVLSPPTLREELHALAREVLALHGGEVR
ncbi:MAG TPA: WYL domain-containing protein [Longimicrobiales bacterium]|jgi:proteasome accessory factor B